MEYLSISTEQLGIGEQLAQKILAFGNLDSLQEKYNLIQDLEILFGKTINTGDVVSKIMDELSNILGQNDFSLDNLMEHFISMDLKKRIRARKKIIRVLCSNPDDIIKKYCGIEAFMAQPQYKVLKLREFFMLQKNRKYLRYFTPDYYGKKNDGESDVRKILQSELGYGLPETFLGFENLFKKGKDSDGCDLICYLLDDKNLRQCYDQYLKVYIFFKDVKQKGNIDYLKNLKKESDKLLYIKAIVEKELGIDLFEGFGDELLADIENIKPYITWKELYDFFSKPTNWKYYVFFSCPKGEKLNRNDQNTRKKNLAIQSIKSLLGCDRDLTNILNEKLTIKAFFAKLSKNGVANINYFKLYVAICEKFEEKLKNLIQGEDIKKRKKSIENIIDLNIKKIINEKKINADRWKYANKETKDFIVNDVLEFVDYF